MVQQLSYTAKLSLRETEVAIKKLKDYFEGVLAVTLHLTRVSAPIFVQPETGLNDDLNGTERPVSFDVPAIGGSDCQIVHSLAKWKRMALKRYNFAVGEGLYTDMNAVRRDEEVGPLHSIYVDQWDWEKIITKDDRTIETLKNTVEQLYCCLRKTAEYIQAEYPIIEHSLPTEISFISTQELEDKFPDLTPKQREDAITKEKGAIFLMQVGKTLKSGKKHDGRAPDYDDWTLNGDIILWHPLLQQAVEISSMGIRVDEQTLAAQLKEAGCEDRAVLPFHRDLLQGKLPYTLGGGIGQSRLCLFFLQKIHIGEVQASVWPEEIVRDCEAFNIQLL